MVVSSSLLGPHQAYLHQRWDDGVRSTSQLHQELRDASQVGEQIGPVGSDRA